MLQVLKILAWSINITKSKQYPKTSSKVQGNTNSTILIYLNMIIKLVSTKVDQRLLITRSSRQALILGN